MIVISAAVVASAAAVFGEIPVEPDGPEGRQWLIDELSKPEYIAAKPSWWDQLISGFIDWLNSLAAPQIDGGAFWLTVVGVLVVVGLIVAAFVIFGRPRLNRRSALREALFGRDDRRSAPEMRAAGAGAAARGEWAVAIEEEFRAIARELGDRTVVALSPGTTAHGLAERAARRFPAEAVALTAAARSFDGVRYLGESGSEGGYRALTALGERLDAATPQFDEVSV